MMIPSGDHTEAHASAILLHPKDNVICLLRDHSAGEKPQIIRNGLEPLEGPVLLANVPLGHKVALSEITRSSKVIKYGSVIGRATTDIRVGEQVHLHNLAGHSLTSVSQ